MSLAIENLKFTIFGSGHDYTLNNSGTGEGVRWFSHPFMAKGSRAYAGMYYFLVADENGDLMDAVKDDIAHCTFTPALGDTFDTVGEQEIRVDYRREYIYDEETLVVEKHLKQTITVVDHGAVASSYFNNIIYADGYCYVNPSSDYVSRHNGWWLSGSFKKISSLPWGTDSISNISNNLEDASEMGFADFSQMTSFKEMFKGKTKLTNIQNFDQIDVSHIRNMSGMFQGCFALADITPLKTWKTPSVTDFSGMFFGCTSLVSTDGLQNFKFDSAYSLYQMFRGCNHLTDLSGVSGWDLHTIEDTTEMFAMCSRLTDLSPLKDWDMSNVKNVTGMFMDSVIGGASGGRLTSLDGLEDWNVSNVRFFTSMFGVQYWLNDISALSGWDVANGLNFHEMFIGMACLGLSAISGWDMSSATDIGAMFNNGHKAYSSELGKYVIDVDGGTTYFDYDGNSYRTYQLGTITYIEQDASAVAGWTVPSGQTAFFDGGSTTWENIPSWN